MKYPKGKSGAKGAIKGHMKGRSPSVGGAKTATPASGGDFDKRFRKPSGAARLKKGS